MHSIWNPANPPRLLFWTIVTRRTENRWLLPETRRRRRHRPPGLRGLREVASSSRGQLFEHGRSDWPSDIYRICKLAIIENTTITNVFDDRVGQLQSRCFDPASTSRIQLRRLPHHRILRSVQGSGRCRIRTGARGSCSLRRASCLWLGSYPSRTGLAPHGRSSHRSGRCRRWLSPPRFAATCERGTTSGRGLPGADPCPNSNPSTRTKPSNCT